MSLEETIPQLLSNLELENYNEVLTTTTNLLNGTNVSGDDVAEPLSDSLKKTIQLIHCRTLITLSKYTQVIEYYKSNINTNTNAGTMDLFLEYAYSLYKLGRYAYCCDLIQKQLDMMKNQHDSGSSIGGNSLSMEGIMHVLAQCQYRLHETNDASVTYSNILDEYCCDGDDDEVLTNALAVNISNTTSIGTRKSTSTSSIDAKVIQKMEQIEIANENNNDNDDEFLYELVYNAATQLLLQSTSIVQTKKSMEWLEISEQKCIDEYQADDNEDDNVNVNGNAKYNKAQIKNLMPIHANIALAKMKLGDTNGSTRSYLELLLSLKKIMDNDSSFTGGGSGGISLTIDNNLAVLNSKRGGNSSSKAASTSVYDLMKRLPDLSTFKDGVNGSVTGAGASSNTSSNASGGGNRTTITPFQVRTILYNRAVLFYKMNKYSECKSVLNSLKKSLTSNNAIGTTANGSGVKANGSKKKKKKGKDIAVGGSGEMFAAPVATPAETILWESRIALLENETGDDIDNGITAIMDKIKAELQKANNIESEIYILEYALAETTLYQAQKIANNQKNSNDSATTNTPATVDEEAQRNLASTLESLPGSLRQRPAIIATLCSLYSNMSMDEKVKLTLESTKSEGVSTHDSLAEYKRVGDFKLRLGLYEEAATIYESILEELEKGNKSLDDDERLECKAGLIKAMSYFDIDSAVEYAEEVSFEHDDLDGEELEAMDIPRLSKGSSGSNKMRKMLGSNRNSDGKQKKKKNPDAILRRRAKKREAHLKKLQKEGKYNPDRPLKPDPERWVPKNQRSYNKRGRKGRTKFTGAQGIGSGAGYDKDAAKLDAAARAAAKAQGKDIANQGRSTAHLAVSSTGNIGKGGRRR